MPRPQAAHAWALTEVIRSLCLFLSPPLFRPVWLPDLIALPHPNPSQPGLFPQPTIKRWRSRCHLPPLRYTALRCCGRPLASRAHENLDQKDLLFSLLDFGSNSNAAQLEQTFRVRASAPACNCLHLHPHLPPQPLPPLDLLPLPAPACAPSLVPALCSIPSHRTAWQVVLLHLHSFLVLQIFTLSMSCISTA